MRIERRPILLVAGDVDDYVMPAQQSLTHMFQAGQYTGPVLIDFTGEVSQEK